MFDIFKSGWKRSVQLKDAELFPQAPDTQPYQVKGGIRHPDLPEEFHHRRALEQASCTDTEYLRSLPAPTVRLEGRGLYAGPFFRHYGHFIAESIHRLWAWMQEPEAFDYIAVLPQVPHPRFYPATPADLPRFQREALAYIGVPLDRLKLILEPVTASDLTVPLQGSLIGRKSRKLQSYVEFWAEHEKQFFRAHTGALPDVPEKVYVSRANFLANGSFAGEHYFETLLAAEGFLIMRPEALSLVDQLHIYRQARLLVFAEGSALHTTELLGPMKADIVCLQRRIETRNLWQSVLEGRSRHALFFSGITPLPSMVITRRGTVATDMAVSLWDAKALVAYFRESGLAKLPTFDMDDFLKAEAADIGRYLVNVHMRQALLQKQMGTLLADFRKALTRHDNPYLKEEVPS